MPRILWRPPSTRPSLALCLESTSRVVLEANVGTSVSGLVAIRWLLLINNSLVRAPVRQGWGSNQTISSTRWAMTQHYSEIN